MIWLTEQAMGGKAGRNYWWIAPIFAQAKIVFRRLKRALPQEIYTANETELAITLINGAIIWFKGADKPDSLFGEDVFAAVMDEATRCKEEAWHALRTTLTATRGPIRLIGNVKGRRNWAYQLARRAEAGEPDMSYAKITALDAIKAGLLSKEEIDDAKRVLPESIFQELYMAEPSDDEGNPFGMNAIRECIAKELSDKPPVAYGLDLAKSVDWSVLIGLDAYGVVSKFLRWQSPWQETIQKVVDVVEKVTTLVDSTGVGDPILEALQRQGSQRGATFIGYHFSQSSKQKLMEGLAVDIQQKRIAYPDGPIRGELEAFEYIYSRTGVHYSAPEGMYDDCVCALALAAHQMRAGQVSSRPSVREAVWG
jgi:hypothetical protein